MTASLDRPALATEAAACRKMWCEVVLAVLSDYWRETRKAESDKAAIARIRADALHYFRSRDGRDVLGLAGLTADPERMADMAVDLTAYDRTFAEDRQEARRRRA